MMGKKHKIKWLGTYSKGVKPNIQLKNTTWNGFFWKTIRHIDKEMKGNKLKKLKTKNKEEGKEWKEKETYATIDARF